MTCAKWGTPAHGAAKWGEACAAFAGPDGEKPDTRLLLDGDTDITDDLGQWDTDLTASGSGGWASAADSEIWAITAPREIALRAELSTGTDGTLIAHASDASVTTDVVGYRIHMDGGELVCDDSVNGELFRVTPPNIDGTAGDYTIQWCTEAYALTTGPGNAYVSELTVYDEDGDAWLLEQALHKAPPVSTSHFLGVGGRQEASALTDTYADTIHDVRIGARWHSSTEAREDWVEESSSLVPGSVVRLENLPVPERLGAEEEVAGPLYAVGAEEVRQAAMRLVGPLWEVLPNDAHTLTDDLESAFDGAWVITPPKGSGGWQTTLAMCVWCPLPPHVSHIRPQVHAQLWATAGSPDKLEVRMYSSSRRPGFLPILGPGPIPPPAEHNYVTAERTANDTSSGTGGNLSFDGDLKIARVPEDGGTYLYLAMRVNEGVASANTRYAIRAASADPIAILNQGGGIQGAGELLGP